MLNYTCNRNTLKHLRKKRRLTQAQLAQSAGYSERLISKAESGDSVNLSTLEDLADALSTREEKIYYEDLICDPVQIGKRYVTALHEDQAAFVDSMRDYLDEDIVLRIAGDPDQIPFAGVYYGIDAADRGYKIFFSVLEVPDHDYMSCYQFYAQGTDVVIWGESWIHPRGMPMEEPIQVSNLLRTRRGKIILFDDRFDTQAGAELLSRAKSITADID